MDLDLYYRPFISSARANFQVFLMAAVGFMCGTFPRDNPIIDKEAARKLSLISLTLFQPCLSFYSIGSRMTLGELMELWPLLLWSLTMICIGWQLSNLVTKALKPFLPAHVQSSLVYALLPIPMTWQNSSSFPLVVMEAMCEQRPNAQSCFKDAAMFIFIYNVPWALSFWGFAVATYKQGKERLVNKGNVEPLSRMAALKRTLHEMATPAMVGIICGLTVGTVHPLQSALFKKGGSVFWSTFGSVVQVMGSPAVAVMSLVLASSFAHMFTDLRNAMAVEKSMKKIDGGDMETGISPQETAIKDSEIPVSPGGMGAGGFSDQKKIEENAALAARARTAGGYGTLALPQEGGGEKKNDAVTNTSEVGDTHAPSGAIIVIAIAFKLFAMPVVGLTLMYLCTHFFGDHSVLLPNNPLFRFILLLECSSPPAMSHILALQKHGLSRLAGLMSYVLVWLYLLAFVSCTVFCAVGMVAFQF